MLSLEQIRKEIAAGEINTVVVGAVDMQGRMIGKRMTGRYFAESGYKGLSASFYFYAMNIEGHPADSYEVANWAQGFGNCLHKADLSTLRRVTWMDKTALVICDSMETDGTLIDVAPRAILKRQVERLAERGMKMLVAPELEFYVFDESPKWCKEKGWRGLSTTSPHHRCLHLLAGSGDEPFMQKLRTNLEASGVPLEATHPEYGPGQQELNFSPGDPIEMADRHIITKMAAHEIANQDGNAVTFMAKYNKDSPGSSCHIHMSLWSIDDNKPLFHDPNAEFGMSKLMNQWTAGLVKYAREYTYFLAPYVNSYKRFQTSSWAPTKACWALDNRTAAFRLCGEGTENINIECRVGGADLNPYLAFAALIAAGLAGIDEGLDAGPPTSGNIYEDKTVADLPSYICYATGALAQSKMMKEAFGERTVRHYVNAGKIEVEEFDKQVTDWELMRGFDRY